MKRYSPARTAIIAGTLAVALAGGGEAVAAVHNTMVSTTQPGHQWIWATGPDGRIPLDYWMSGSGSKTASSHGQQGSGTKAQASPTMALTPVDVSQLDAYSQQLAAYGPAYANLRPSYETVTGANGTSRQVGVLANDNVRVIFGLVEDTVIGKVMPEITVTDQHQGREDYAGELVTKIADKQGTVVCPVVTEGIGAITVTEDPLTVNYNGNVFPGIEYATPGGVRIIDPFSIGGIIGSNPQGLSTASGTTYAPSLTPIKSTGKLVLGIEGKGTWSPATEGGTLLDGTFSGAAYLDASRQPDPTTFDGMMVAERTLPS